MANAKVTDLSAIPSMTGGTVLYAVQSSTDYQATRDQVVSQILATGLTAAGSNQGTALALTAELNQVATVNTNTGVSLPVPVTPFGKTVTVINAGANALKVYPPSGAQINALGSNNALSVAVNTSVDFHGTSATQFYSVGG
jgi:hypothetical protein